MCGRAVLSSPVEDIALMFDALPIDIGVPRFNVAPSQPILTVRPARDGSGAELALVRWGLIPWWSKADEAKRIGSKCVQARAETVTRSPAFRDAFKRHRCLVVFDGFYEWKTLAKGKQPHFVQTSTRRPLAIAGVWDGWRPPTPADAPLDAPDRIESGAVITTRSAGALASIHDRMPLVLPPDAWSTWLRGTDEEAARLLDQTPSVLGDRAQDLVAIPVSTWVNDVKHEDPRCIAPAAPPTDEEIDSGVLRTASTKS